LPVVRPDFSEDWVLLDDRRKDREREKGRLPRTLFAPREKQKGKKMKLFEENRAALMNAVTSIEASLGARGERIGIAVVLWDIDEPRDFRFHTDADFEDFILRPRTDFPDGIKEIMAEKTRSVFSYSGPDSGGINGIITAALIKAFTEAVDEAGFKIVRRLGHESIDPEAREI
jgi:hypothetical protein